jgi:hypothetical protein
MLRFIGAPNVGEFVQDHAIDVGRVELIHEIAAQRASQRT